MVQRRPFIAAMALPVMVGCASGPDTGAPAAPVALPGRPQHWRTLQGGFLAPALPGVGLPPRAPSGMYVRWAAPVAVALLGSDLLLADRATARLWRADLASQAVVGIAGAPVVPGMALALGPDLSAWVLDPGARQVLRFARDGRLLQTYRVGADLQAPNALALADGGATLMLADTGSARWSEQRGVNSLVRSVLPESAAGLRISGVDGIAVGRQGVYVLDKLLGVVHQVTREGQVTAQLGRGDLMQPVALAVDRMDRVYVLDAQDNAIKRLRPQDSALRWSAAELGVQRLGGLAADGMLLAVSDLLGGQVVVQSFAHDTGP